MGLIPSTLNYVVRITYAGESTTTWGHSWGTNLTGCVYLRVKCKCCLVVYESLHGQEPTYQQQFRINVTEVQRLSALRSKTHTNILPRTKTSPSHSVFKHILETHLFRESSGQTALDIIKRPSLWQCSCTSYINVFILVLPQRIKLSYLLLMISLYHP